MTFEEWVDRFLKHIRALAHCDEGQALRRAFELGDSPDGTASAVLQELDDMVDDEFDDDEEDDEEDDDDEDDEFRAVWRDEN